MDEHKCKTHKGNVYYEQNWILSCAKGKNIESGIGPIASVQYRTSDKKKADPSVVFANTVSTGGDNLGSFPQDMKDMLNAACLPDDNNIIATMVAMDMHCEFDCGPAISGPCPGNPTADCWLPPTGPESCSQNCKNYNADVCPSSSTPFCAASSVPDPKDPSKESILYLNSYCEIFDSN